MSCFPVLFVVVFLLLTSFALPFCLVSKGRTVCIRERVLWSGCDDEGERKGMDNKCREGESVRGVMRRVERARWRGLVAQRRHLRTQRRCHQLRTQFLTSINTSSLATRFARLAAPAPIFAVPGKTSALPSAKDLPLNINLTEEAYRQSLSSSSSNFNDVQQQTTTKTRGPDKPLSPLTEAQIYTLLDDALTSFTTLKFTKASESYKLLHDDDPNLYLPLYPLSLYFQGESQECLKQCAVQKANYESKFSMAGAEEAILHNLVLLQLPPSLRSSAPAPLSLRHRESRPVQRLFANATLSLLRADYYSYLSSLGDVVDRSTKPGFWRSGDAELFFFYMSELDPVLGPGPGGGGKAEYLQRGLEAAERQGGGGGTGANGVLCLAKAKVTGLYDEFPDRVLGPWGEGEGGRGIVRRAAEGLSYEKLKGAAKKGGVKAYGKKAELVEAVLGAIERERRC